MRREVLGRLLLLAALLLAGALAFWGLFRWDNKYTAALPGGEGYNVLQSDLEQVAFLVDGWYYYPGQLLSPQQLEGMAGESTYIGAYPNFSAHLGSPYGVATYCLVLENPGDPVEVSLWLPELLCAGRVYLNGELVGEHGSLDPYTPRVADGVYSFTAGERTQLVIQCANYTHYYSGLYYPPAVGSPGAIARLITARLAVYGLLCFGALAVALSQLGLWLLDRDRAARRLGVLCLAFALRVCYPFLRALGVPLIRTLYALEDVCGGLVLLCAILLAGELSGRAGKWYHRYGAVPAAAGLCAATALFPLLILPNAPAFINAYGLALFVWKLLTGLYLLVLAVSGLTRGPLSRYLLSAAGLYGLSMAASVLTVGRFEPIRGAWPEEYGGFALVLGFAALMAHRGVLLAAENRRLTDHLQEEVNRKTQALETLLTERRELLANLIHDLKNPLTAVRSYADLVRGGGVALDRETAAYLDALADRVGAVEDRFDLLQGFSRGERGVFALQPIPLNQFLSDFYQRNLPDIELSGQTFRLELPAAILTVAGDRERLGVALENLCYNTLSFTPEDGTITLSLAREGDWAVIGVTDTGAGIAEEDLPHVFERGFTRRAGEGGDGLGLFIVRTVALEHGGTAAVTSRLGRGSCFTLRLPLAEV